jgi:4-carboxymuconolactone decarboxylase
MAMAKSPMHETGSRLRQELMGPALADKLAKSVYTDPLMEGFADWTREAVFGLLWTRPGLDLKTRALITVITDTATAAWPELRVHLRMARNQGWTEAELGEALLHTAGYIGAPSAREALLVEREVFEEMRAEASG